MIATNNAYLKLTKCFNVKQNPYQHYEKFPFIQPLC